MPEASPSLNLVTRAGGVCSSMRSAGPVDRSHGQRNQRGQSDAANGTQDKGGLMSPEHLKVSARGGPRAEAAGKVSKKLRAAAFC